MIEIDFKIINEVKNKKDKSGKPVDESLEVKKDEAKKLADGKVNKENLDKSYIIVAQKSIVDFFKKGLENETALQQKKKNKKSKK